MSLVPTLTTERLTLRGHRLGDWPDAKALWSDPEVTRHIGGRPSTHEECWSRFLRHFGHWAALGFGYWAAIETATDRFVGEVGLANLNRELEPPLGDVPEAGWVIRPWAHGKGYATEAMHAVLAWAPGRFAAERVVCLIDPGNQASHNVARKLGFREVGPRTYHGSPTVLYERP